MNFVSESESSEAPSSDPEISSNSQPRSRVPSHAPPSPRKRARSGSIPVKARKYHLEGAYNDDYRNLYNEVVETAAARFQPSTLFRDHRSRIGVMDWSAEEKSVFFAALERLGKDNVPGIAQAVGTKSIPEVREYLVLLQNASQKAGHLKVTLKDIPAAVDVSVECDERLELIAEALAYRQELFEAKQEQDRFGDYWLVTRDLAQRIERAIQSRAQSESPSPLDSERDNDTPSATSNVPQFLVHIPEADLLRPMEFIELSVNVFMNRAPDIPSPWAHWTEFVSEAAPVPCIYRTAFNDFHALVVSLTRRLTQVAIIQATSRLRSRTRKSTRRALPFVKERDVHTALDILGLARNGRQRWAGVARRCGIHVRDSKNRGARREIPWDELEQILLSNDRSTDTSRTGTATPGLVSGAEEEEFRSKATRRGTPLPTGPNTDSNTDSNTYSSTDEEYSDESENQEPDSDAMSLDRVTSSSMTGSPIGGKTQVHTIEDFDQEASRNEEKLLHDLFGFPGFSENRFDEIKTNYEITGSNESIQIVPTDDWRSWTNYRAEWEELETPIPLARFLANRKRNRPADAQVDATLHASDSTSEVSEITHAQDRPIKRRRLNEVEMPIRGARAYAANLQEQTSMSGDRDTQQDALEIDNPKCPVESVEDTVVDSDG